jgi:hypothetical protein
MDDDPLYRLPRPVADSYNDPYYNATCRTSRERSYVTDAVTDVVGDYIAPAAAAAAGNVESPAERQHPPRQTQGLFSCVEQCSQRIILKVI